MNRLIVIGWLGVKRAYLNISLDEARARYESEHGPIDEEHETAFSFDDEFCCYDAYPVKQ